MGIEFQTYRSWEGTPKSVYRRVLAMIHKGVPLAFKSKWVIALVILAYFFGVVSRLLSIIFMPVKFEPAFFQGFFNDGQLWFILLSAVVGSGLIADDVKHKSIVLYFSRLPKIGYLAGKFGVLAGVLSSVVLVPGVLLFTMVLLSSSASWDYIGSHLWILGAIITIGVFIIMVLSSVSLAFSSLTSDKRYAGAGVFMIFLFSGIMAEVMKNILGNDRLALISIWDNIRVVSSHLFSLDNPYGFPWYESLVVLAAVLLCSTGILYWTMYMREVRV